MVKFCSLVPAPSSGAGTSGNRMYIDRYFSLFCKILPMKAVHSILLAAFFACSLNTFGQNYQMVWSDEFNADTLNTNNWSYEIGNGSGGWGNNEKEYYTNRPENIRVQDGKLIITARKESYNGFQYTSARILTKNKQYWKYGRIEMRAKLPKGRGTWPAFWMLPEKFTYGVNYWPDNGEIDIMEYVGYEPAKIHGTVHMNKYYGGTAISKSMTYYGVEDSFHTYSIEWSPEAIKFYVDNYYYGMYQRLGHDWQYWPYDQNFFILLNFAVGGNWGGAQGIDDNIFPQTFEIDYVRVYKDLSITTSAPVKSAGEAGINVWPNPVHDVLHIRNTGLTMKNARASLYNAYGNMVVPPLLCENEYTSLDLSWLNSGVYMLLIQNSQDRKSFKLIKN